MVGRPHAPMPAPNHCVIPAKAGIQGHDRYPLHRNPRAKTRGPSRTFRWVAGSSPAMTTARAMDGRATTARFSQNLRISPDPQNGLTQLADSPGGSKRTPRFRANLCTVVSSGCIISSSRSQRAKVMTSDLGGGGRVWRGRSLLLTRDRCCVRHRRHGGRQGQLPALSSGCVLSR